MRLLSAIIVSGVLLTTNNAQAVPRDEAIQERNPIEWLLSDIGSLFRDAVDALDQQANEKELSTNQTDSFANAYFNSSGDADLFGESNFNPVFEQGITAENQKTEAKPSKSISGFFDTLLAFLKQNTESNSETSNTFDDSVVALADPDEKGADAIESAPKDQLVRDADTAPVSDNNPVVDLFAVLNDAAAAFETDNGIEPAKDAEPVLNNFFASLGDIFKGPSNGSSTPLPADLDLAEVDVDAVKPAQETDASDQIQRTTRDATQKASTNAVEDQTSVVETTTFESAPWQVFPHVAVFAPEADLFDDSHGSLPANTAVSSKKTAPVEVAESVVTIRKRTAHNPAARNHLSLGRTKTAALPEEDPSFLGHLIETFTGGNDSATTRSEVLANKIPDRLIPEEKLDLGYTSPDAVVETGPQDELTTIGEGILKNIDLYLGTDTVIGRPYQSNMHQSGTCIERSLQVSIFCVTNIDWPAEVASSFAQDTAFTLPGEGVVRYENGRISRVYTPFKANDFAEVVKFMQRRFGPPLEREIVWMHMIEAPKMPNTTFRWRAVSADRQNSVVLEVRNFDDLRRSFADLNRGMVRLYRDGSRPIFKHLSTMDLMLIQRRRLSQAPVTSDGDTAAN